MNLLSCLPAPVVTTLLCVTVVRKTVKKKYDAEGDGAAA